MKKVPLTKRLEVALTQTSSDIERDKVYGLLTIVAKDVLIEDQELFYGTLTHETLSLTYNRKTITSKDIQEGKDLAEYLRNSINFFLSKFKIIFRMACAVIPRFLREVKFPMRGSSSPSSSPFWMASFTLLLLVMPPSNRIRPVVIVWGYVQPRYV